MKVLVTGAAGFIGMAVAQRLLARGDEVVGVDSLNDYYDPALKRERLRLLEAAPNFRFVQLDLADRGGCAALFAGQGAGQGFERVVHLAAQAGVRYSLQAPHAYVDSNLVGFVNMLEACRHNGVQHLVYASSSSVYGGNERVPFSERDGVDHPVSLYAATKKANELMAHTYSHLYRLPTTGLRFFTVYGPYGRPDMAPFLFARAILAGESIDVFNHGQMQRDFTYIDDIAEGVVRTLDKPATPDPAHRKSAPDPATSDAPYRLFNIGNHRPVALLDFIACLEKSLGRRAKMRMLPMQPGDVPTTFAEMSALQAWIGFAPSVEIGEGVDRFVAWYRSYYKV